MADDSEPLGLRSTLDLISSVLRTVGAANATGAFAVGTALRFFSDVPSTHEVIKTIFLFFLFGVVTFALSYAAMFVATLDLDRSMRAEPQQWENLLFPGRQTRTVEETRKSAKGTFIFAMILGLVSFVSFLSGLFYVLFAVNKL
jgi:hypothetical protein